jgi:hypothetical protein
VGKRAGDGRQGQRGQAVETRRWRARGGAKEERESGASEGGWDAVSPGCATGRGCFILQQGLHKLLEPVQYRIFVHFRDTACFAQAA